MLFSNIMSTKRNTISVSYCRNWYYPKHFECTHEFNRDVYRSYTQTRRDPRTAYIKRLTKHWYELHPDLRYFSEKQLQKQATFVESKSLILETNLNDNGKPSQLKTSIPTDEDITPKLENPTQSNKQNDQNSDENLLNDLKLTILFYGIYKNLLLRQRNFDIQVNYNIKRVELQWIIFLIKDFINYQKEIIKGAL